MKLITLLLATLLYAAPQPVIFTDITGKAGIQFTHNSGRAGKKFLPETMGSGCAFLDADGDGWPDILLINSKDFTPRGRKPLPALYHNNHNGTFTNITAGSGLDVEMYPRRITLPDAPAPTSKPLEANYYLTADMVIAESRRMISAADSRR